MIKNFTLNELKKIHEELVYLRSDIYIESKIDVLRQKLDRYCQMIVWGDKNNPQFFYYFLQMKSISIFFDLFVRFQSKQLNILAVDSLSKLIINLSDNSNYALLSNCLVMNMQTIKFVSFPTELAEYYINFLKSLSLKLNQTTIYTFFNQKYPTFPLAWQAARFYNHPESLIRTTSNSVFPPIMKLRDNKLVQYLCRFPFVVYYSHLASHIRQYWFTIAKYLDEEGEKPDKNLRQIVQDHFDLYIYFEEMMKISHQRVVAAYLSGFISECLAPLYLSLMGVRPVFKLKTILFVLGTLLKNGQNRVLLDLITALLFGRVSSLPLTKQLSECHNIISYNREWTFKSFWDDYDQKIQQFCLQIFERNSNSAIMRPSFSKQSTPSNSRVSLKNLERESSTQISVVSLFGVEHTKFDTEVIKLSKVYGLLYNKIRYISILQTFNGFQKSICSNFVADSKTLGENKLKDFILMQLKSKEDSIVTLTLEIYINVLKNSLISKHILQLCGLARSDPQNYNKLYQEQIVKSCLELFRAQPGAYRIATLKNGCQLIYLIAERYRQQLVGFDIQRTLVEIYKKSIHCINKYIFKGGDYDKIVELYQLANSTLKAISVKNVDTFGLNLSAQVGLFERFPQDANDLVIYEFAVFFLIRNLRYSLISVAKYKLGELTLRESLRQSSTSSGSTQIQQSNLVNPTDCHFKELAQDKYRHGLVMSQKGRFILVQKTSAKVLNVVLNINCKYCVCVVDKSDPRKLIMSIKTKQKDSMSLTFKDAQKAYSFKHQLEQSKTASVKAQFEEIVRHVERCSEDVPIFK